jgi:hypothetical protein
VAHPQPATTLDSIALASETNDTVQRAGSGSRQFRILEPHAPPTWRSPNLKMALRLRAVLDPASVEMGHFGLEGIRQRVRLLGGRLAIESTPGSGTLVQAIVPILERQAER